jgi:hypothetical protein
VGRLVGDRSHRGPHALGEEREHVGVDAVGFRELAHRASEVAHLARVDHDHRQRGGDQGGDHEQLVATRGFEHDQLGMVGPKAIEQRFHAALIIGDGPPFSTGPSRDHQLGLGDIDADQHQSPPRRPE